MADPVNIEYRQAISDWIATFSKKTDEHIQTVKEQTKIQAQTMHSQSSMIATQLTRIESKDNDYQHAMSDWAADIASSLKISAEQSHYLNTGLRQIAEAIRAQTKELGEMRTALENHSIQSEANTQNLVKAVDNLSDFVFSAKQVESDKEEKIVKAMEKQRKTYIYHMDEIAHILRLQDSTADYRNELLHRLVKVTQNPDRVIRKD